MIISASRRTDIPAFYSDWFFERVKEGFVLVRNPMNPPGVPKKSQVIDTFKRLSDRLCPERVIWRYDPIVLNNDMDVSFHEKYFDVLAGKLHGCTNKCILSFVDYYKSFKEVGTSNKSGLIVQSLSPLQR